VADSRGATYNEKGLDIPRLTGTVQPLLLLFVKLVTVTSTVTVTSLKLAVADSRGATYNEKGLEHGSQVQCSHCCYRL
jgi:hypothetical protein